MVTLTITKTNSHSPALLTIVFLLASLVSIMISLSLGSVSISIHDLWHSLFSHTQTIQETIIIQMRLPRTLCAFITGGLLALSGALMQTLLRNPLADPYVLGISGGSAVATLIAMMLGIVSSFLNLWAFIGSVLSMFLVLELSRSRNQWSSLRLLLTGVVVATGWAALISFILTISPEKNLRSMLFWLMGDLNYAQFSLWQPIILFAGLMISLILAKPLNILSRGDLAAQSLGVNTKKLNIILYLLSSLLTACAVSIAGCIGFVGLIIPHMLRLMGNSDHRFILPASVLLGGILLTLADTLARTVMSPLQLPVGIVTAFIGVPCFLILLQRGYRA